MGGATRVHFIGIGGSGMSPLARILIGHGAQVSGSDIRYSPHLEDLAALGADVYQGHDLSYVDGVDLVVVSAAVPGDDPELRAARERGARIVSRAELLGDIMRPLRGIAVTGTHGKTTTSGMIAVILNEAGLDPTVAVGAGLPWTPSGGKAGSGEFMVVEADEAYGSFLKLDPEIAVVTNIDDDHRDYYETFEGIMEGFVKFLRRIKPNGFAVLCADDENVLRAARGLERRIVYYGITSEADYAAADYSQLGFGSRFSVMHGGTCLGQIELSAPGTHNMNNAIAAVAVCDQLGIDFPVISRGLAGYRGAERRCEVLAKTADMTLVDDYAHHPVEIRATLAALRKVAEGRLVVVFQPQRYTRTKYLRDEFVRSFSLADVVAITDIYYEGTGESPIPGVSGRDLAERIAAYEGRPVTYLADKDALDDFLRNSTGPGDTVVTMGAGDIYRSSRRFAEELALEDASSRLSHDGRWKLDDEHGHR